MSDNTSVGVVKPSWLPEELYQMWLNNYIEAGGSGSTGSAQVATEMVRQSPEYETFFPGIKREDGSLRYPNNPEATYLNNIESFRNTVASAGLNPEVFGEDYVSLIEGDVAPTEFNQRVESINARVLLAGPDIRQFYADTYGLELSDEGIIGSLLSPRVGDAILSRQITMAEVGGTASSMGFGVPEAFVELLVAEGGMDREEARRYFGNAKGMIPVLRSLAQRHGDPDDTYDITELASGDWLGDVSQAARDDRLVAQEQALFTGGAGLDLATGAGGVAGLMDR